MKIPIVFAINDNYAKFLSVVLISILKNTKALVSYEFNILNSNLSNDNQTILSNLVSSYNSAKNVSGGG